MQTGPCDVVGRNSYSLEICVKNVEMDSRQIMYFSYFNSLCVWVYITEQ